MAAALASVLAVFPNTTHQNLAKMLKTSVRKVSTLPNGLGVVDFTRLTTLDASGEWRLVTNKGEFNEAVVPLQLNHVTLPGNAAITSDFAIFIGRRSRHVRNRAEGSIWQDHAQRGGRIPRV